jgi:hypothetical protein
MEDERRTGEVRYFRPILLSVWNAVFAAHDLHGQAQLRRNAGALELCLERSRGTRRFLPLGSSSTRSVDSHAEWTLYRRGLAEPGCRRPVNFVGLWLLYEQGVVPVYLRKLGLVPTHIVGEKEERQRIRRVLEKRPSTYTPTPTWGAEH